MTVETMTLYRLYGHDGALLYIGVSKNWSRRMRQHAREKEWWDEVANVATQAFQSRDDVAAAEERAIKSENPRYNLRHNPKPPAWSTPEAIRERVNKSRRASGVPEFVEDPVVAERIAAILWPATERVG